LPDIRSTKLTTCSDAAQLSDKRSEARVLLGLTRGPFARLANRARGSELERRSDRVNRQAFGNGGSHDGATRLHDGTTSNRFVKERTLDMKEICGAILHAFKGRRRRSTDVQRAQADAVPQRRETILDRQLHQLILDGTGKSTSKPTRQFAKTQATLRTIRRRQHNNDSALQPTQQSFVQSLELLGVTLHRDQDAVPAVADGIDDHGEAPLRTCLLGKTINAVDHHEGFARHKAASAAETLGIDPKNTRTTSLHNPIRECAFAAVLGTGQNNDRRSATTAFDKHTRNAACDLAGGTTPLGESACALFHPTSINRRSEFIPSSVTAYWVTAYWITAYWIAAYWGAAY
jgi:hypothetical protein